MSLIVSMICAAGKSGKAAAKKGAKYVVQEAKDAIANHTQIGRRLREGVHSAREAVKTRIARVNADVDGAYGKYVDKAQSEGYSVARNLSQDSDFVATYNRYAEKTGLHKLTKDGKTDEQIFQELIETSGVGPTKFAQIISNDQKIMSKIENPALRKAITNTRSDCSFSRTIEEAQDVVAKSFPGQNFVLEEELKAGSIGAAYLVKRPDGSTAVLKMLKKGVDKEQLALEEKLFTRLVKEFGDTPDDVAKHQGMLKSWYKDWAEELDFTKEFQYNKTLANGAKRYKVADITNISKDGTCIIMNKANGIQMDKLVEILNNYKSNPTEFASKYAEKIKENPWLADPEKVMKELPTTLLKTFDEQFMFMKKGGKSLMHGDPHTGNFFITADDNGKLIPEFIDTGNCVARTSKQIKDDINFFTNYFVGNSDAVAKYFIKQCDYNGPYKNTLTKSIAKEIQEQIFGKKHNITKFSDVQSNIMAILEKYGLHMSSENATAMKAQMQFFSAVAEAGKLSGQSLNIGTLLKDIPQASWGMVKTGINPWSSIKDALKFACHNQKQAVGTAYQFTLGDIDQVVKADGSIAAIA